MPYELADRLVVGIAPSALFDTSRAHQAFLRGIEHYRNYQQEHLNDPLPRGAAFPFIKRLLALNDLRPGNNLVEVIVMAKDDAVTGLRIMKSIEHYKLPIDRAVFTEGKAPYDYIGALNVCLYLSGSRTDVETAASLGFPAGRVLGHEAVDDDEQDGTLRVALDFDGVLADDEAERIYRSSNLATFLEYERAHAAEPLGAGPMKQFLVAMGRIQQAELDLVSVSEDYAPRVRVAMVTARQAPAHERAVETLRSWNVQVNDAFFLGGIEKASVLAVLAPHIYFDDQIGHLEPAQGTVASVLVPYGIANDPSLATPVDEPLMADQAARQSGGEDVALAGHAGKYRALSSWLDDQVGDEVAVTFAQVEEILGMHLPPSARKHLPHWYGYEGSALGRAIRDAGWRASGVNLTAERLTFVRDASTSRSS